MCGRIFPLLISLPLPPFRRSERANAECARYNAPFRIDNANLRNPPPIHARPFDFSSIRHPPLPPVIITQKVEPVGAFSENYGADMFAGKSERNNFTVLFISRREMQISRFPLFTER